MIAVKLGGHGDVTENNIAWTMKKAGAAQSVAGRRRKRTLRRQR